MRMNKIAAYLQKKSKDKVKKRGTLYSRLLIACFLFSLIPTLLISVLYYNTSSKYINEVATELGISMINQTSSELENFFSSMTRIGDIAADNQRIQETLRQDFNGDIGQRYSTDLQIDSELYFARYLQPDILGLVVLGDNGGEYKSHDRTFKNQIHKEQSWYQEIQSSREYTWFPPHVGQFANVHVGEKVITCGKPIVDKATGEISGIVMLDIKESAVREIISTRLGKTGYMIILDENNQIIFSPDGYQISENNLSALINSQSEEYGVNKDLQILEDTSFIATYKEMPSTGWKLMGIIPMEELSKGNQFLSVLMVISIGVTGVLALLAAYSMSSNVVKPFRKLMNAMKKVEDGDLSVKLEGKGYEEAIELTGSFNLMVIKMDALMNNVYQEQKKLRKAEMKALQAQINPHFLYNTLDSILWLNRDEKREEIQIMVEALTRLFRIGLSRGKDIISIRDEIAHVESYLKIQSIRYGDKFDYAVNVDETFMDYQVPKLILQPLVENAIYHGIKLKMGKGHIEIRAVDLGRDYQILVQDTGKGIAREKLQVLNQLLQGSTESGVQVYGIANVNERIKILFGNKYGLKFKSQEGKGTTAILYLPKKFYVEEE